MMPVVRISDATFADLSTISSWLKINKPSQVIDKLVSDAMSDLDLEPNSGNQECSEATMNIAAEENVIIYNTAPGLAFTKVLNAQINTKQLRNPKWGTILLKVISIVRAKGCTGERLVRELNINAKAEEFEDNGYRFYPDLEISVQGQSAPDAWKEACRLAKKWRIPMQVEFQWRDNPKAQNPGRRGKISVA